MDKIEPIKIEMDLETTDIARYFIRVTFGKSKLVSAVTVFLVCLYLFIAFFSLRLIYTGKTESVVFFALLPTFLLVFFMFAVISKVYKMKSNVVKVGITFSEEKIDVFAVNRQSEIAWTDYYKILETEKDFFLRGSGRDSFPVPKRFFNNETEIQSFKKMARLNIADRVEFIN